MLVALWHDGGRWSRPLLSAIAWPSRKFLSVPCFPGPTPSLGLPRPGRAAEAWAGQAITLTFSQFTVDLSRQDNMTLRSGWGTGGWLQQNYFDIIAAPTINATYTFQLPLEIQFLSNSYDQRFAGDLYAVGPFCRYFAFPFLSLLICVESRLRNKMAAFPPGREWT